MKKFALLFLGALAAHLSYGQHTEISAHLTSGGMKYHGASATRRSGINVPDLAGERAYTNNPYGRQLAWSYGLAGQVQHVGARHSLVGVQAGYEVLRSRVQITVINTDTPPIAVTGHTTLSNQFINLHPFFGHRFTLKALDLDVTAGPEVGFLRGSREQGEASGYGASFVTDAERNHSNLDVRARVNVAVYYKRTGVSVGYSAGVSNYRTGYLGSPDNEAYSQVFRIGLAYRISL